MNSVKVHGDSFYRRSDLTGLAEELVDQLWVVPSVEDARAERADPRLELPRLGFEPVIRFGQRREGRDLLGNGVSCL
jgi:hypothetical protein